MKGLFSKFSKREQLVFILTISGAIAVAAYIFLIDPIHGKWADFNLEVASAKSRLLKSSKLLENKDQLEKEYQKYKEYIQGDDSQDLSSVLKEVEADAMASGVKITSIKPKGAREFQNYKEYGVELMSEGSIDQLVKFIYELEGSKRLLKVQRLILSLKSAHSDLLKGVLLVRKISFSQ